MSKKRIIECPYCDKTFNYYGASCFCECHHCHYVYDIDPGQIYVLKVRRLQFEGFHRTGRIC